MARFDVYPNPDGAGHLLDVQADLLDALNTRVVVPLMPRHDAPRPAQRLNPVFTLDGIEHVMVTQFLAAVPLSLLRAPSHSLAADAVTITTALDMLMQGF